MSPTPALAHASDRGHVLLLPTGHYLVGGALAVAASFLVLLFVRPEALERLSAARLRLGALGEALRLPLSLASFAIFAILVAAGFFGSRDPLSNPLPLTVWTLLWVGLTLVQGLFGNLWYWINPWYGPWRIVLALLGRSRSDPPPLRLPHGSACGRPSCCFVGFAWFELIYPAPDDPGPARLGGRHLLAVRASPRCWHSATTPGAGGANSCRSSSAWCRISASSNGRPPTADASTLCLPGAKLSAAPALPASGTLFLLLALASVSFDGLSKTFFWFGLNGLNPLEYPGRTALIGHQQRRPAGDLRRARRRVPRSASSSASGWPAAGNSFWEAAGTLVWSIVPIALAYHFSHYLTALLVNGQYALVALSDPFALGWNLFGTAHMPVSAAIAAGSDAAWVIWNAQAAAIVGGHIWPCSLRTCWRSGCMTRSRAASLSQLPLTVLMIAYTVFGLWLLSTPTAG